MRTELEVVEDIITRLKAKGYAQGIRNKFEYIRDNGNSIVLSRERGQDTPISRDKIVQAVAAVRLNPSIYQNGPNGLRDYIKGRIYSPLWALLHLVSLSEINS